MNSTMLVGKGRKGTNTHMGKTVRESDDTQLLGLIATERHREAFAVLFQRYERLSYSLAYRLTRNSETAREAVQESMLRVWLSASSFDQQGNARAWIMRIVACKSLNVMDKERRKITVRKKKMETTKGSQAIQKTPQDEAERSEVLAAIRTFVDTLPVSDQKLVALYYGGQLTQSEIAKELSIPQTTISQRLAKSLEALRATLGRAGFASASFRYLESVDLSDAICSGEQPPQGLLDRMMDQLDQPGETLSAAATSGKNLRFASVVAIAFPVMILAVAGEIWWQARTPIAIEANNVGGSGQDIESSRTVDSNFIYTCDFNAPDASKDIEVFAGSWKHDSGDRRNASGCMKFDDKVGFVLNIPIAKLPIKVSFRRSSNFASDWKQNQSWSRLYWDHHQGVSLFRNTGKDVLVSNDYWSNQAYYVTEEAIVGAEPQSGIMLTKRRPGARLLFTLSILSGTDCIDDLEIRSVHSSEVPSIARFTEALNRIPPSKRRGSVEVPELKSSRPPHPVVIDFYPAKKEVSIR